MFRPYKIIIRPSKKADPNSLTLSPKAGIYFSCIIQGDSVARSLKLLSIKNYVIEIMT